MIITGGKKIITRIQLRGQEPLGLQDLDGTTLLDLHDNLLYSEPPSKIVAVYKGRNLIWLTTYQVDIKSCYGSGVWLDNYNWIEDQWKD